MNKYNRGDQGFFESSTGRDAKFPESLRTLFGGLANRVAQRMKPLLLGMSQDLMDEILAYLTHKSQVALMQTSKSLRKDVGRTVSINRLLSLVAQGCQAEAEAMIEKDPSLLLERGDVTDGAGRTFRGITALQYPVWALDAHMWTMILPLFPDFNHTSGLFFNHTSGLSAAAGEQLRALEEKGTAHGQHFDFKPLLDAYATSLATTTVDAWCRGVGGAQVLLPDHVRQEYIHNAHMRKGNLTDLLFNVAWSSRVSHVAPDWGLSENIRTTIDPIRNADWACTWDRVLGETRAYLYDRKAIRALCTQRRRELTDLLRRYGVEPSPAAESKSPGPER